jgi:hypothetical protein
MNEKTSVQMRSISVAATVVLGLACSDASTSRVAPTPPAQWSLAKLTGNDNLPTDTVMAKLAPVRVVVRVNDVPLAGAAVTWNVGGTMIATFSSTTDHDGVASLDFAFGSKVGLYVLQAVLPDRPEVPPVSFSGTALPGHPTAISAVSGSGQTDTATAKLRDALVVRVIDSHDNPTTGVAVDWSVTSGGGSVQQAQMTTLAPDGTSSVRFTLGRSVGTNAVTATLHGLDATVTFQATASAANPAKLTMVSGNNQIREKGHTLDSDYVVKVSDNYDNPASGVAITWAITGGGGTLSASTATSAANGLGSTRSTLGPTNIVQSVKATLSSWPKVPAVTFFSTGITPTPPAPPTPPPPPPTPVLVLVSGGEQAIGAGATLSAPIVVKAIDAFGHPLVNETITFAVTSGGGSVTPTTMATNALGLAQTSWTVGPTDGPQTMIASAAFTNTVVFVHATAGTIPLAITGDPSYYFYFLNTYIGIGQYTNAWVGPSNFEPLTAPLTVSLSHGGALHTSIVPTVAIPTGAAFTVFRITGTSVGLDSIVASAPGYGPGTLNVTVDSGSIDFDVTDSPPSVGVSKGVGLCIGPGVPAAPVTFALAPNANIRFVGEGAGGSVITSVTIPAESSCAFFLVQGLSAGTGTVTITSPNYRTKVGIVTVTP